MVVKYDLSGLVQGNLKILNPTEERNRNGCVLWLCQCVCGNVVKIPTSELKRGQQSCGCKVKHGFSKHPLYKVWSNIKDWCYRVQSSGFKNHGARQIKMAPEWLNDPSSFIEYCLFKGWRPGMVVHRRDLSEDYAPGNIAVDAPKIAAKHVHGIVWVVRGREYLTLADAAKATGIQAAQLHRWCKAGKRGFSFYSKTKKST